MNATVLRRGNIKVDGHDAPIAAVKASNDLIGLRDEAPYFAWFEAQWAGTSSRQLRNWIDAGIPGLLSRAATQLRDVGTLPFVELAPLLEGVRHQGSDQIVVTELPALAAWALVRAAEANISVTTCGECEEPWLSRRAVDYCYRPAPGKTMTCAQTHAHARFAEHQSEWNREYRRVYARKLRGTVTDAAWRAWLDDAQSLRPVHVLPFDTWKALDPKTRRNAVKQLQPKISDPDAFLKALANLTKPPSPD